ncbi:CDT1-like protein b [Acorus calamus]|uniref:CDT1-like protein b n=1 Tax=Acorus calamus TaxID=4465 RepID=A0AAV9DQ19_ACOCL|nr:CDT1-like protein b [Acorus calamus]
MDHERCEESRQTSLDFRCKKIIQSSGKLHVEPCSDAMSGLKDNEVKLDSPTPEKLDLPPRTHQMRKIIFTETSSDKHVPQVELPEKYKKLTDFFNRMETSVRLLRLRKKLTNFENISRQVEVLTKRKFLYSHLAQIKYIFPDALKIEPVLVHDERSLCMKPDMKITLLLNVADDRSNGLLSLAYCKAFHEKILEFYNAHPECDNVPEAELPESFNLGNFMTQQESSALVSSMKLQFSQKILVPESEMTHFQTSRGCLGLHAKEIENGLKNNKGFQETGLVKRQQMLAYLPELFYTVRHVFQSTKCSVITKEELIHKILFHNCNIEETREAEELLGLLEELVPDWICGRTVSSGDFLYRIQKTCDPESIRVRLVDAII